VLQKFLYQRYISTNNEIYSYSVPLRPDIFIELNGKIIIFDAKYRVNFIDELKKLVEDESNLNKEEKRLEIIKKDERRGIYKLDDIYKMHTYREAIIKKIKDENKQPYRPVWVIALYPGDTLALFLERGTKKMIELKLDEDEKQIKFRDLISNEPVEISIEELLNTLSENSGGVGAIPFRPVYLDDTKYKEFLKKFFKMGNGSRSQR